MVPKRPQLGRILLRHGAISEDQLNRALQYGQDKGCRLGEALIALGVCSEVHVARALAEQLSMPFVDLDETPPARNALQLLPKKLAQEFGAVPVRFEGSRLVVAARNPFDFRLDDLLRKATGTSVLVVCGCDSQLVSALQRYDDLLSWQVPKQAAAASNNKLSAQFHRSLANRAKATEESTADTGQNLIVEAVQKGATEIHFEPERDSLRVRGRIEGQMVTLSTLPRGMVRTVLMRMKTMCGMETGEERAAQEGTCHLAIDGARVPFRAFTLPSVRGESIVFRVANPDAHVRSLDDLAFAPEVRTGVLRALTDGRGLFVVTGPARCGKTTTLYSLLAQLQAEERHVVAVENVVEENLAAVRQIQVGRASNQSLADPLRAALKQGPDVVLIEELHDAETLQVACEAASAGRLILAGVPGGSAVGALTRLMTMEVAPELVAGSLSVVLAQRLMPRVCDSCGTDFDADARLERDLERCCGPLPHTALRKGVGCDACDYRGTRGSVAVHEFLCLDEDLRYLLARRIMPSRLERRLRRRGCRTLAMDAMQKTFVGLVPAETLIALLDGAPPVLARSPSQEPEPVPA